MKRFITSILFVGLLISSLYAGPFGLEFGWTIDEMIAAGTTIIMPYPQELDELKIDGSWDESCYQIIFEIVPPSPSDLFQCYEVQFDSKFGLYKIEATKGESLLYSNSSNIKNPPITKNEAKHIFNQAYSALVIRYGLESSYLSDNSKYWWADENHDHLDISLKYAESSTHNSGSDIINIINGTANVSDFYNGLYYVSLTYDKKDYLKALKDSEIF